MIANPPDPQLEQPPPTADPLEYVSPSRLKSYLTCPQRFFHEKVLRTPRPVSPALHLGKAVHHALQAYHKARWRDQDSSEETVLTAFHEAFALEETPAPVAWISPRQREELQTRGASVVTAFLSSGANEPQNKPAGVEVRLEATRDDLPMPLLGIVDLVKADGTPVDYKTCASTPDVELEGWLHELQLVAYTLLVEDATDVPIPGCELVFLVKTKTPKVIVHRMSPPDAVQVERFRQLVMTYAIGVTRHDYHPQPGMHCAWCPYRAECSQWKGRGP